MKRVEISVKEILAYVLRQWKGIAAFTLSLLLLYAAFGYYIYQSSMQRNANLDSDTGMPVSALENENTTRLSFSFVGIGDKYVGNLVGADAAWWTSQFYSGLIEYYLSIAQNASLIEVLGDLVPESTTEEMLRSWVRADGTGQGIITITVLGSKNFNSNKSAEAIFAFLQTQQSTVSQIAGAHRLVPLGSNTRSNPNILYAGNGKQVDYRSYVVVFLVGLVVAIIVAILRYLISIPMQLPEQIQSQLKIKYLGGVRRKKYSSLGDRVAGSLRLLDEREAMDVIAANIADFAGENKKFLITGTLPNAAIKEFMDKLIKHYKYGSSEFIAGEDLNLHPETIEKLMDCDGVILIERLGQSRLKVVNQIIERIEMSGKEILGYALY